VYSASDFDKFSQRISTAAKAKADMIVAEASRYARNRLNAAEKEAKQKYEEGRRQIEKEVLSYEKEEKVKIETSLRIAWQQVVGENKKRAIKILRQRIEREFESLANCFLQWLMTRYDGGRIELYEHLRYEEKEGFKIVQVPEKVIRFTRANLIVVFTSASVVEEFTPLIDEALSDILKKIP